MLKQLTTTQVWVHDQDEALAFYTEKLGLELREDVTVPEMGNFRWLTVGVPGQPDIAIVLMAVPGPPVFDAETREQILALVAKGAAKLAAEVRGREVRCSGKRPDVQRLPVAGVDEILRAEEMPGRRERLHRPEYRA